MRLSTIKHVIPWGTCVFLILFALVLPQFFVEVGSPIKEGVRDPSNRAVIDRQWVEENLNITVGRDNAYLIYKIFDFGDDVESDKERITRFIEQVADPAKTHFENHGMSTESVLSVANFTHPDGLRSYLEHDDVDEIDDSMTWARELLGYNVVDRNLAGFSGDDFYFVITILPPSHFSEMDVHASIQEFLTGKPFAWWQRFFASSEQQFKSYDEKEKEKKGFTLEGVELLSAGWLDGRAFLMRSTFNDVLIPLTIAICFLGIVYSWLALGSFVQALLILIPLLVSMLSVRAAMFYLGFWESVFSILDYVVCIIPSFSYGLRMFEEFNAIKEGALVEKWQRVRQQPSIFWGIVIVWIVSVAEFFVLALTNYHGVEPLWQIGVLCMVGATVSAATAYWGLPVLHSSLSGSAAKPARESVLMPLFDVLYRGVVSFVRHKWASAMSVSIIVATVCMATYLFVSGHVATDSSPQRLLRGTPMETAFAEAETYEGSVGNYMVHLAIRCDELIYDPESSFACPQQLVELHREVRALERTRSVAGYADAFEQIVADFDAAKYAQYDGNIERFMQAFDPSLKAQGIWSTINLELENNELARRHFFSYEEEDADGVKYDAENIVIVVASTAAKTTGDMRDFRDAVLDIADQKSAFQEVRLVNDTAGYPDMDFLVRDGYGINLVLSIISVITIGGALIMFALGQTFNVLKAFKYGLLLAIPFVMVPSVAIIAMAWLGIPLDVATSAQGSVIITAALDLPLFLLLCVGVVALSALATSDRFALEIRKFFNDFVVNTSGFVPLAVLDSYVIVEDLGLLLVISMCVAMISSLLILPLKYRWIDGRSEG